MNAAVCMEPSVVCGDMTIHPVYWCVLLGTRRPHLSRCHAFVGCAGSLAAPQCWKCCRGEGMRVSVSVPGLSSSCVEKAGHSPLIMVLLFSSCMTSFLVPWTCAYIPSIMNCLNQSLTFIWAQLLWEFRKFRCVSQPYVSLTSTPTIYICLSLLYSLLTRILLKEDSVQYLLVFSTPQLCTSLYIICQVGWISGKP